MPVQEEKLGKSFRGPYIAEQDTVGGTTVGGYYKNDDIRRYTDEFGEGGSGGRPTEFTEADAQRLRDEQAALMKPQLDAIEERYTTLVTQEQEAGKDRSGRTRALGARSGLIGSGRGEAQLQKTEKLNSEAMKALMAEKGAEIQAVYGRIDERARQAIADERLAAGQRREDYLSQLKDRRDQAREDLKVLGTGGLTADDLDEADLNELMKDSGLGSKFLVEAYLNGSRPEGAKTNYQYKTVGNKIIAYGVNPQGELVTMEDDLPFAVPEGYSTVETDDGRFLFVPKEFDPTQPLEDQIMMYGEKGEFSKPGDVENDQLYSGLSSPTATAVRAKVNAFKSEQTITNFSTLQEGYNFAKAINLNTKNPADDQALIYALAKALDPGSVVREGEYATAQKYAQSWVNAYGKAVTQAIAGTGFLSKQARENIKKTIEQKYTASKKSYDSLYNNYERSINNLTGRDDGKEFLTDYTVGSSVTATAPDGSQYEFDPNDLTEEDRQALIDEGYSLSE